MEKHRRSNQHRRFKSFLFSPLWTRAVAGFAAIVIFSTTYWLILPASALTKNAAADVSGLSLEQSGEILVESEETPEDPTQSEQEEPAAITSAENADSGAKPGAGNDGSALDGSVADSSSGWEPIPEAEQPVITEETTPVAGESAASDGAIADSAAAPSESQTKFTEDANAGKNTEAEVTETSGGTSAGTETSADAAAESGAEDGVNKEGTVSETESPETEELSSEEETTETEELSSEESEEEDEEEEEVFGSGKLLFRGNNYSVTIEYGEDAKIPGAAELRVRELDKDSDEYKAHYETAKSNAEESGTQVRTARFFDITIMARDKGGDADAEEAWHEIEPAAAVKVSFAFDKEELEISKENDIEVLHYSDEENVKAVETVEVEASTDEEVKKVEGVEFDADGFSVFGFVETETITVPFTASDGCTYEVSVNYGEAAGIPKGARLEVSEVTENSSGYQYSYEEYVEKAAEAIKIDSDGINYVKLLDIKILDEDGNKVTLSAPVVVRIRLLDGNVDDTAQVVHFADGADEGDAIGDIDVSEETIRFDTDGFSVYAVIGGEEPTARMQVNFHIISYDSDSQPVDTVLSTVYVKRSDDADALKMIMYDPGIGQLGERESFRGWTFNKDYDVEEATSDFNGNYNNPYGAMTIEDIRNWALQKDITEDPMEVYHLYAMVLKHYTVTYLDRFGVSLDTDSAYMLRDQTTSNYTINKLYETGDEDYHFKGWVTKNEDNIALDPEGPTPEEVIVPDEGWDDDPYNLYKNNTDAVLSGDVTLKAHAPKGKWLIFNEVMKGATYTAPQFLEEGQEPVMPDPDRMLLLGYEFDGWYKTYTETIDPETGEVVDRVYSDPYEPGPITEKTTIYAKWKPAEWAPYTVIIWKQNLDGTYSYAESVQLYGNVGRVVSTTGSTPVNTEGQATNYVLSSVNNNDADYLVIHGQNRDHQNVNENYRARHTGRTGETHNYENEDYVGFNCARIDQGVTINPEGNAVVNVYYDRITYTIKIYHARRSGNNYNVPTTRSNNNTLSLGGMNWTGNITTHENANGTWANGYQGPPEGVQTETSGNYTYYYTTITAKYGEDISDQWPKYGDYTNLDTDNQHNQHLTFVSWYMMNDAAGYRGNGSGLDTFKGVISKMDEKLLGDITRGGADANYLIGRYDTRDINIYTYQIWKEALLDDEGNPIIPEGPDGRPKQSKRGSDGLTYYLDDSIQANSNADPNGTQAPEYIGYEHVASMDVKPALVNHRATIQFHYHRVKNPIIYRDGSYFDGNGNRLSAYPALGEDKESDPIPYETDITSYNGGYNEAGELVHGDNYKMDYPSSYDGFVFEGWYADAACTMPYAFDTMPDSSITVYAKFRQKEYRVFLRPNVPAGKEVYWGSDSQQLNFRGSYGGHISTPTGKLILNGDPEQLDESYEFAGWYRDPQYTKPFDGDAFELNDDLASPYDKTTEMTDYMDKYGNIGPGPQSQDPYNSDLIGNNGGDRWWITQKIELYGKWVKKLDAGTGIQVRYDPNGGSDEVRDDTLYKDGTHAVAQSAPETSPTTVVDGVTVSKVFLYWVLQEWNPTAGEYGQGAFVDKSPLEYVYPGETFDVSFEDAQTVETIDPVTGETKTEYFIQLRAEYTDPEKETPTHIWWYSNFGENSVVKVNYIDEEHPAAEDILINEAVSIKPENTFTRPGYTFLGWARVNSTDGQGTPVPGHPALHPELDEDDLFLRYVEAAEGVPAHFEAKNDVGNWVPVTQVAADEKYPYHDLYAVWKPLTNLNVRKYDDRTAINLAWFKLLLGSEEIAGEDRVSGYTSEHSETLGYCMENGEIGLTYKGLLDGVYSLVETKAPDGYIITNSTTTLYVHNGTIYKNRGGEEGSYTYSDPLTIKSQDEPSTYCIDIINEPGVALPSTGGPGTRIFTILGGMMIALAGALLLRKRRFL